MATFTSATRPRFVLVDTAKAARPAPLRLQPIAWGTPDPVLAKNLGALLLTATPKFRFKGLRCLLRAATA